MDDLYKFLQLQPNDSSFKDVTENHNSGIISRKEDLLKEDIATFYDELLDALKASHEFEKSLRCKRKYMDYFLDNTGSNFCPGKDDPIFYDMLVTLEEVYSGCLKVAKIKRNIFDFTGCKQCTTDKKLEITVKSGAPPGTQFRFVNLGDQHHNRIPADIVFTLKEKPHDRFVRVNSDLHYVASIDLKTAVTGGSIAIKSIDGKDLQIKLTNIIEPKSVIVVPNQGMIRCDDKKRGDLVIRFDVTFPLMVDPISRMIINEALDDDNKS
ncbi:DnaJ-like protein subfamily B member 1 [Trichoplax sp. H2]|uniref:Chaperone DnaJ C-terminal domain-containing protein n=1 Tax=Trichoplax adhaerens TaxID=10228 RepID=B3S0Q0_TRIAD|nr:hypothetical protein TRIADDRAFT_57131 [Trichoplax adhaerens]EDV23683.1 hypothetical protein TRIADDRAFT_57131 [Trichoplax adhaerens]RDD44890.1 DnaJ-like protein subfamily B member 1 [Trichoplax sp. H2]|eukprot:XP_002113209.1 hypothetical protein TRIADDRAFT_57131 [Trichoplax adhaerens]